MRTRFRAPWDLRLTLITAGILLLLLGLLYWHGGLIPTIITWSIILGTSAFGVYGYSIQDGKLKILRLGWSKEIPLSSIDHVEAKPHAMMGSMRIFGIGGLFAYVGSFRNGILGSYKAYATHSANTVLIDTGGEQIIVTPDNPREFTEAINHKTGSTAGVN